MAINARCLFSVLLLAFASSPLTASPSFTVGLDDAAFASDSPIGIHVREIRDFEIGNTSISYWTGSPHELSLDERLSPSQDSLKLTDEMSLVIVVADYVVDGLQPDYELNGQTFELHATKFRDEPNFITNAYFPPSDFLVPIGRLPAGDYQIDFEVETHSYRTDAIGSSTLTHDFQVRAVPEPSSRIPILFALLAMVGFARSSRRSNPPSND